MNEKDIPRNVVAHMRNGDVIPLDLYYAGLDNDGVTRIWRVVQPPLHRCRSITIGMIPAKTMILLDGCHFDQVVIEDEE